MTSGAVTGKRVRVSGCGSLEIIRVILLAEKKEV
jgi:hypothetical protein